jgi:hypothetical protein
MRPITPPPPSPLSSGPYSADGPGSVSPSPGSPPPAPAPDGAPTAALPTPPRRRRSRKLLLVLGLLLVGVTALAVLAVLFAEPGYLEAGESYTDDFASSDASLFSQCFEDPSCPLVVEGGRLRFDVPRPMSIGNLLLDADPSESIRSITLSALVFPGEQVPGVAGGPACGWGTGGVTAQLFADGTLELADMNTAEPLASTSTPALASDEAAMVQLTCSQPTPDGEVSVEAQRVGLPDSGDQGGGATLQATAPANRSLAGAGFAAQSGETAASVHFDDLEVRVD